MTKIFQNFYCSGHVIKYVKQKKPPNVLLPLRIVISPGRSNFSLPCISLSRIKIYSTFCKRNEKQEISQSTAKDKTSA